MLDSLCPGGEGRDHLSEPGQEPGDRGESSSRSEARSTRVRALSTGARAHAVPGRRRGSGLNRRPPPALHRERKASGAGVAGAVQGWRSGNRIGGPEATMNCNPVRSRSRPQARRLRRRLRDDGPLGDARAAPEAHVTRAQVEAVVAAASRAPSWANTQPWEVFVAGGETLERIRQGYLRRAQEGVERALEIAAPASWPEAHRARIAELMRVRSRSSASIQPMPTPGAG